MTAWDVARFSLQALAGHRLRSWLLLAAMAIGVAAVVVLTGLGEGARGYVSGEFRSLGTNLLIVLPGRTETRGGPPPLLGETPRPLTLQDATALLRSRAVRRIAPLTFGTAPVSRGGRSREAAIMGSTADFFAVRHLTMGSGRPLPAGDPERAAPVCVLGAKLRAELFGSESPLGKWVRIGDRRFRVIGVVGSRGLSIGLDLDEMAVIPVAAAQALFNSDSLFRILVEARSREEVPRAQADLLDIISRRHEGEDDITVITQDALLSTFDRIFTALTLTVAGIAAISLGVAGILIMNVMLVAVAQRRAEIGLLKALGAAPVEILVLFLAESTALALAGALLGLLAGQLGTLAIRSLYPSLPVAAPWWAIAAGLGVAVASGALFGVLPARRAARLDPVQALSRR
jgi:putative ABC transport system permease protein